MISLIHPSRGRPEKSLETCKRWIDRAGQNVQLVISFDRDDTHKEKYQDNVNTLRYYGDRPERISPEWIGELTKPVRVFGICHSNESVVGATNRAARSCHGDVMIYLSDDFDCPEGWAALIEKEFADATGPRLIKVDDCLQMFHVPVLTIPIMNRALHERLGYFWHPGYKSMFCDEHLYHVSAKLGALKMCPHLKFEHKHVSVGKAEDDETYRRSSANWNQGKELFERHKKQGFPV